MERKKEYEMIHEAINKLELHLNTTGNPDLQMYDSIIDMIITRLENIKKVYK